MEQLLTDEQIAQHAEELRNGILPNGEAPSQMEEVSLSSLLESYAYGAKWARDTIMEKLTGRKVYTLYCYPDPMQTFYGVFLSKEDAQNAVGGNCEWKGDNKDYLVDDDGDRYDIEEVPFNPASINDETTDLTN